MDSDQPSSMLHVRSSTLYPLPAPKDNGPLLPFGLLCGETRVYSDHSVDGLLAITNYRFYLQTGDQQWHVPLGLIEMVEVRDMFYLHIGCKDARSYRCTFENNEQCGEWFRRLVQATAPPRQLQDMFAFYFRAWAAEREHEEVLIRLGDEAGGATLDDVIFKKEVERLGFDLHGAWRISYANINYRLCPSYPPLLLVPACITDDTLETVARFRSSRRIPAVVWRHAGNGAVIARCSQPEVGWLGWRSSEDEDLLKAIADACAFDKGPRSIIEMGGGTSAPHTPTDLSENDLGVGQERPLDGSSLQGGKKVLIMDARSYTTAVANRARGGGCECPEYYPSCDIQFMNLANIHSIRKSFHALRQLCSSAADQPNWWSLLEGTRWLQHMSGLMRAAGTLVAAVERDARPVLVHCSDGWDRTPQIVALAEVLLDPYYRTIEGFRVLVEREWLAFGHKFADRCGHAPGSDDQNERCPVFLQWLDCVHQLLFQFPCNFQFANTFLVKLAQHTYSNVFGTFLCNTKQERVEHVYDKTFSVWRYLNAPCFINHLYTPTSASNQVLWPACNVRDLQLWSEVYIGSLETSSSCDSLSTSMQGTSTSTAAPGAGVNGIGTIPMTKTRSYGDLIGAAEPCANGPVRRSSDPNITLDTTKITLNQSSGDDEQDDIDKSESGSQSSDIVNGFESDHIKYVQEIKQNGYLINHNDHLPVKPDTIDLTNGYKAGDQTDEYTNGVQDTLPDGYCKKYEFKNSDWVTNDLTNKLLKCDLKVSKFGEYVKSDINHNGAVKCDEQVRCVDDDSDNDRSESKSEVTLCPSPNVPVCRSAKSNETSTDTLVAENGAIPSDVPEAIEGPEATPNGASDGCEVCAQSRKFIGDKHFHHSRSTSGKTSRYSTPPPYSRTPSGSGVGGGGAPGPGVAAYVGSVWRGLDVDGLAPLRSDLQHRLWQIQEEHRIKEEALQRELHTTRMALIKQVCHNCSYNGDDRPDDTYESDDETSSRSSYVSSPRPYRDLAPTHRLGSLVGSVCSTGEGQASVGESLPSDMSWEALDEGQPIIDSSTSRTLWVPDHAVSRCTGCHTEFWLGRRKHHCRNCGRIFCADCSENSTPLPNEQLFNPVRVCTSCYVQLRRACPAVTAPAPPADLSDKCKHTKVHTTTPVAHTQVTASSN